MTTSILKIKALAGLLLAVACSASAATYTNVPGGANNGLPFASFGNAGNPSGDSPKVGEVFSFTEASTLSSFSFYAIGQTAASLQLNVAQWNPDTNAQNQATNLVGANLLTTTVSAVESFNSTTGVTTLAFGNLNLSLNAGTKYIAYITSDDASVTGLQLSRTQTAQDVTGFGIGHAYLSTIPGQGWQLPFGGSGFLSLQYTAETAAIPEPSTYAAILGVATLGFVALRRKQKQVQA